jgi:hypothetical protein
MLKFGKYAAVAAAGLGLAALAAPSANAACAVVCGGQVSSLGWGHTYGMATAYRPVTTLRPVLAFRPVYGLAYHRPSYGAYGYAYHRPSCGACGYAYHRPSYGGGYGAYGYAAPVRHFIRPIAFRMMRPATYAWAVPHVRVYHPISAFGAAYGFAPRFRTIGAYGCGC